MSRTQYDMELQALRESLVRMGETAIALLGEALHAVAEPNPESPERASELESKTDHQHRLIHDQCLSLITRQAPVARDARLITGILDAIVDLELIGDYAYEISTLSSSMHRRPPSQVLIEISSIGTKAVELLTASTDSWRSHALPDEPSVRSREAVIRTQCGTLHEKLSQLAAGPGDATIFVDLMLMSKHLERISRHSVSVAEQAAQAAPLDVVPRGQ